MPPVAAVRINVDTPSLLEHTHRERDRLEVMSFVIMESSLKHDHRYPAELTQEHFAFMSGDGRASESEESGRKGQLSLR